LKLYYATENVLEVAHKN